MIARAAFVPFYHPDDFVPDRSLGYLAKRLHQRSITALEPVFAAEGLSHQQWAALVTIWTGRASTGAELARELAHDPGAMTRLVDALVERGWLTRERDDADRRIVRLAVTPAGYEVADRCRRHVLACWNGWLADWSPAEVEDLIGKLQRLLADVEANAPCA